MVEMGMLRFRKVISPVECPGAMPFERNEMLFRNVNEIFHRLRFLFRKKFLYHESLFKNFEILINELENWWDVESKSNVQIENYRN